MRFLDVVIDLLISKKKIYKKNFEKNLNFSKLVFEDLALVSLANVYHQAGMLHSALIAGAAALNLSPEFVVIHFTLANIYSAMASPIHYAC